MIQTGYATELYLLVLQSVTVIPGIITDAFSILVHGGVHVVMYCCDVAYNITLDYN